MERPTAIVILRGIRERQAERIPGETIRQESPYPRFPVLEIEIKGLCAQGGARKKNQCQKCHKLPQHALLMQINTRVQWLIVQLF
jgi:hypothetical protein